MSKNPSEMYCAISEQFNSVFIPHTKQLKDTHPLPSNNLPHPTHVCILSYNDIRELHSGIKTHETQ